MEVVRGSDRAFARLTGEVDSNWVETYKVHITALFEDFPRLMVVDLTSVTFMDSTGLGFLARCVKSSSSNNGQVYVSAPNELIRSMIHLVGLDGFVKFVTSTNEIPNDQAISTPQTRRKRLQESEVS